jgi:hypothetical protein
MSFDTPDGIRGARFRGGSGPVGRWVQQKTDGELPVIRLAPRAG